MLIVFRPPKTCIFLGVAHFQRNLFFWSLLRRTGISSDHLRLPICTFSEGLQIARQLWPYFPLHPLFAKTVLSLQEPSIGKHFYLLNFKTGFQSIVLFCKKNLFLWEIHHRESLIRMFSWDYLQLKCSSFVNSKFPQNKARLESQSRGKEEQPFRAEVECGPSTGRLVITLANQSITVILNCFRRKISMAIVCSLTPHPTTPSPLRR